MMQSAMLCLLLASGVPAAQAPNEGAGPQIVRPDDYAPCGVVSLYAVAKLRNVATDLGQVKELVGPSGADRTHSFADLSKAAQQIGLHPVGLHAKWESLGELPMPAIVQVRDPEDATAPPHLFVLLKWEAGGVTVLDPPHSPYVIPESRFRQVWTGNVLIFPEHAEDVTRFQRDWTLDPIRVGLWSCVAIAAILCFVATWKMLPSLQTAKTAVIGSLKRFWPVLAASVLCLFVAGLAYVVWPRPRVAVPDAAQCVFQNSPVDLGSFPPGSQQVQLAVSNPGNMPLQIAKIRSTCSCAAVETPEDVNPGESGNVKLAIEVVPGPKSATLIVDSNDPRGTRYVTVSWRGHARPYLVSDRVTESNASFGQTFETVARLVFPGGSSAEIPTLESSDFPADKIEFVAGPVDRFANRVLASGALVQAVGEADLRVKVRSPDKPGSVEVSGRLAVRYGKDRVELPLSIQVRFVNPALKPTVDCVVFSATNHDALVGQEKTVRIQHTLGSVRLTDCPAWLQWKVEDVSSQEAVLTLRVREAAPAGESLTTLTLAGGPDGNSRTPFDIRLVSPGTK